MLNECAIGDCHDPVRSRNWCTKHYTRWLRHGDPLAVVPYMEMSIRERFEARVDRSPGPDACHPWQGPPDSQGYGCMAVNGRKLRAHVIAWELEHGPVLPGTEVDHECHNRAVHDGTCQPGECAHRLCCNERHLKAKTPRQHRKDSPPHAHPRGAEHPKALLTPQQVHEIRKLLASGMYQRVIASRYGVSRGTISAIKYGGSWASVR